MRSMKHRTLTGLGVLALTAGGFAAVSGHSAAQAADRNGKCEKGEFCYNFNSDLKGAWSDFTSSVGDYGTTQPSCYDFKGKAKGHGKCIKNDAGGFWNKTNKPVTIYFNSGYAGRSVTVKPGAKGKLPAAVYNNNASHRIGKGGGGGHNPAPSGKWASPVPSSAVITARAYYSSGRYHGAVDYSGFNGKFRSACNGTIDSIAINRTYANRNAYGVTGSTNYLWVNCGGGIRMGYAHWYAKDLPSSLKRGTKVKAGQNLVNVGNQGNSSGQHLHFQVERSGKQIDGHDFLQSKGVKGLPRE
ncbi:M23 family metallopeptidase [Luteipulveratus halotolerans]|uniref:M23 family metallopeptidase n=1 Tax=Luteipulveratus halotolerans TaxID=1631356 RepID=UPI0006812327|nr:M23 family metallopeptidase [Luteipulveratus halotolerans]